MIFNSIRWRLQAWHGLILTVIVGGFGLTAYQLESAHRLRKVDDELQKRSVLITGIVRPDSPNESGPRSHPSGNRRPPPGPPPDGGPRGRPPGNALRGLEPPTQRSLAELFDGRDESGFYYIIWDSDGKLQSRSTNTPAGLTSPAHGGVADWQSARTRDARREFLRFTMTDRCILVGRSIAVELAELRRLAWLLVAAGGAVLALGLAGGWWVSTHAMRPIQDISDTAERIATGDLSQRINAAKTKNELGQLADTLNATFERLEKSFTQQKQFTADASHELRTPLAVMISEAQMTLARERSPAEYRETVEACLDTAQQMRRLTESLLELARLDAGSEPVERARFDLAETSRACITRIRPLAVARGIQIHSDLAPAETLGHPDRFDQVVTNLLTNAIQHNKPNGEIRICTRKENGFAFVSIADTGPGISAEDLPHIFERFYRADKSRSRANGGVGLGLAICKAIVESDGGNISVASASGAGTTLTVRLKA